jgi:hypothetical protein
MRAADQRRPQTYVPLIPGDGTFPFQAGFLERYKNPGEPWGTVRQPLGCLRGGHIGTLSCEGVEEGFAEALREEGEEHSAKSDLQCAACTTAAELWLLNTYSLSVLAKAPAMSSWLMTLPLLSTQGKKKIKLFVRYGARIRREVDAPHKLSDAVLGVAIYTRSFGPSFSIRHGCLPSIRNASVPKTESTMVNKRLTIALRLCEGRVNSHLDGSDQSLTMRNCSRPIGT